MAIGTLLVLGAWASAFVADNAPRLETLAELSNALRTPAACPLCAAGTPLDSGGEPLPSAG